MWRPLAVFAATLGLVVGCSMAPSSALPSSSTGSPSPAAVSAAPSAAPSPTVRVLGLDAVLEVAEADRFETFGDEAIRLESVWSPFDPGLGGTCLDTDPWLECGLEDWLIQPSPERDGPTYDGPRLDLFYAPGVRERLGRDLRSGEGPLDVVGHFGDPASQQCGPANRDACRDRFVVTAIDLGPQGP